MSGGVLSTQRRVATREGRNSMRSVKTVALSTAVLLAATACGGGDSEGGASETPKSLPVWVMGTAQDPIQKYFDKAEKRYQKDYPETKVELEFIPWPDAQQSINNALAGGDAPDVLEVGNDQVANWASQGAIMDITTRTEKWTAVQDMDQAAVDYGKYDGDQFGIPWFSGVRTLYYRSDWLADLDKEPPRTWDELVEVAKA